LSPIAQGSSRFSPVAVLFQNLNCVAWMAAAQRWTSSAMKASGAVKFSALEPDFS
jgi:hypothetical protein